MSAKLSIFFKRARFVKQKKCRGNYQYESRVSRQINQRDIFHAKKYGAAGVVFSLLLPDGSVDEQRTVELVAVAKN
ncbi:MAG: hypothetical protein LBK96_05365 [Prevotellaceae bacterium]|jgi:copper homeostasis protein CutC|nr:hypothetical protein [Prevotellaceae bacterium]